MVVLLLFFVLGIVRDFLVETEANMALRHGFALTWIFMSFLGMGGIVRSKK